MTERSALVACACTLVLAGATLAGEEPGIVITRGRPGGGPPAAGAPLRVGGPGMFVTGVAGARGGAAMGLLERARALLQRAAGGVGQQGRGLLGVSVAKLPPALRAHLDVRDGVGLLVVSVVPESPAARAGIRQYDVLTGLGQQLLINADQLGALLRMPRRGGTLGVSILRRGKPHSVTVKLGPARAEAAPGRRVWGRGWRVQRGGARGAPGGGWIYRPREDAGKRVRGLLERFRGHMEAGAAGRKGRGKMAGKTQAPPKAKAKGAPKKMSARGESVKVWKVQGPKKPRAAEPSGKKLAGKQKASAKKKPGGKGKARGRKEPPGKKKPSKPREPGKSLSRIRVLLKIGKYTVSVGGDGGRRTATVVDSKGNVLFKDLPEEKWERLPKEVRELLKNVKIRLEGAGGTGLRIRI